ncbi:MAG: hypothetical protein NC122_02060 [Faecalibacterium sp.]|nr:hypothetical protein [Ruminococcus sp.]MCM1393249.1 hypothetical protein [Ruminococcus sp.]MCM1484968.1 hypothetical protein [Faecalibacterium sp.]
MKKFIALLLSVLMIVSSLGIVSSAADDEIAPKQGIDVENLLANGDLKSVNILGVTLDYIYNTSMPIFWKQTEVKDGVVVQSGIDFEKNELTLLKASLNSYFKTVLTELYADDNKLFTSENVSKLTNFIGHLINPDYTDVYINFNYVYEPEEAFYRLVVEKSGLGDVIQHNWCYQNVEFKTLMKAFGVSFESIYLESDYSNGQLMGQMLVKAIIKNALDQGPVNYFLDLLSKFAAGYKTVYYPAVKALFQGYLTNGQLINGYFVPSITETELQTLHGLFNLIVNHNDKTDTEHLHFMTMPVYRFASAADRTELFLYVMIYLNLIGKDAQNALPISKMIEAVNSSDKLSETDKTRLTTIINVFLNGTDLAAGVTMIQDMLSESTQDKINDIKDTVSGGWRAMLSSLLQSFLNFWDRIYQSFINFGKWYQPEN